MDPDDVINGYARAPDGAYIAYQTLGSGPLDLVWSTDWMASVDRSLEMVGERDILRGLARFARVILHDRRAIGASSRDVPVPNLETRVSDLLCVLDTIGAERPILGGEREGGTPNVLLAATRPERVRSLVWYAPVARSTWAPDYPWGVGAEYVAREVKAVESWGTAGYADAFVEQEAAIGHEISRDMALDIVRMSRHTATPDVAKELTRVWYETDVRDVLPSVQVPTLLLDYDGVADDADHARHIASMIPGSRLALLPGIEATAPVGPIVDEVRAFLGVERTAPLDSVLATVLFTDIVGSTEHQASLGDRRWTELLDDHHRIVRETLARWHGSENDTAGDGFYATFEGPARAIRCALDIGQAVRSLGIEVRAGVHTGECEVFDGKHTGLAVTIGARVSVMAGPSEVLVSQTVKDLVAGSGFSFEAAGEHELKGVPDRWRLYRVAP